MAELTPEARAAIREAVEIVRQDKQHAMLREIHARTTATPPTPTPTGDPTPPTPPAPGPTPPPPAPAPTPEPTPTPKRSSYWGEIIA
jgi:hypothetical protein